MSELHAAVNIKTDGQMSSGKLIFSLTCRRNPLFQQDHRFGLPVPGRVESIVVHAACQTCGIEDCFVSADLQSFVHQCGNFSTQQIVHPKGRVPMRPDEELYRRTRIERIGVILLKRKTAGNASSRFFDRC